MADATETVTPEPETTTPEAPVIQTDPETQAKIDKIDKGCQRIAALAIQTINPANMTKSYAKLGEEYVKLARVQKASVKEGSYTEIDYKALGSKIEDIARYSLPTRVDMDLYAKVYGFIEAVKPIVPNVENLSYYQITSKFLPLFKWDRVELKGDLRDGWHSWVKDAIARQLGDDKLSMKDLDASIADKTKEIADARAKTISGVPADVQAERDRIKADKTARQAKKAVADATEESVNVAILEHKATGAELIAILESTAKHHNVAIPIQGCDPSTANGPEFRLFVAAMMAKKRVKAMRFLHAELTRALAFCDSVETSPELAIAV